MASWMSSNYTSEWGITAGVIGAAAVAYLLWAAVDFCFLQRDRKGPMRWPILGSAVEVVRNYHHINDWVVPYYNKYGLTFPVELPNMSYTYTADPANVEHILKDNFTNYPKGAYFHEVFEIFLGDGIFNTDGEIWRKQRKTASFEFASRVLRDYSTVVFRDNSLNLAYILNLAANEQQPVDMQDLSMRFTLDSMFKISFGIDIGTLQSELPDIPFATAFELTNEITTRRFMDPLWKLKRYLKIGTEATLVKSAKEVDDFTYDVIKTRRGEMAAMRSSGKGDSFQVRKDLFTRFLLLNEEDEHQFTDKNFRDTILNFVIAGRDTTAVTLSWFVYMMTCHPEIAQKIYKELCAFEKENVVDDSIEVTLKFQIGQSQDHLPSFEEENFSQRMYNFSKRLTYDTLMKLHYLHACILETLRLYPAVPNDPKSVLADDILPDGTRVKKGTMVMYTSYAMGRLPALWGPDATEFKPERWLSNGVVKPESPFKFTAFQAGPRICLGKDSALLQLRMATAIICRFFTFQLVPGFSVKYRQMSTLLMANGISVTITKRLC